MRDFGLRTVGMALAGFLMAGSLSKAAFADTYDVIDLGAANAVGAFGLTDDGTAVLRSSNPCVANGPSDCYFTYTLGGGETTSASAPALPYDDGVACSPMGPGGATSYGGKCNGAYDAFVELGPGLYVGPVGAESLLAGFGVNQLQLNAVGDALWTDGSKEEIFEAVDLTPGVTVTPEPSTLALLGTGCLGAAASLRRRLVRA